MMDQPGPETNSANAEEKSEDIPQTSDLTRRDQLLRYLKRTANIDGPRRDLIFLESAGSPFGLPADLVDLIELDAVDNRIGPLIERVSRLKEDEREAVLRLLVATLPAFLGVEAENVLRAALTLVQRELVREDAASGLTNAILSIAKSVEMDVDLLPAAYRVASSSRTLEGRTLQELIATDARLDAEENDDEVMSILDMALEQGEVGILLLRPLAARQPDGFAQSLVATRRFETSVIATFFDDQSIRTFASHWGKDDSNAEAQIGDMQALTEISRAVSNSGLAFGLLSQAVEAKRADLIEAWLNRDNPTPDSPAHTEGLLRAVGLLDRSRWSELAEFLDMAPSTDSDSLYSALADVATDLADVVGEWDNESRRMWTSIKAVWGEPRLPKGWTPPSWTRFGWESSERQATNLLLHDLAHVDKPIKPEWLKALLVDYQQLIASEATPSPHLMIDVIRRSAEDWLLFSPEDRTTLLNAVGARGPRLSPEGQRTWKAHLSGLEGGPEFPWSADEIRDALPTEDPYDLETIRVWLRRIVSQADVLMAFVTRLAEAGQGISDFAEDVAVALGKQGPSAASQVLCHVFQLDVELSDDDVSIMLRPDHSEEELGNCIAELVREAGNDDQRTYVLNLWRLMAPEEASVRRNLIEALRVMGESGKNALRIVLRNIDLASDPPRGSKGAFVEAIQERADDLSLRVEADKALERAGLIRVSRRGVLGFGRRTEITPEDEANEGRSSSDAPR